MENIRGMGFTSGNLRRKNPFLWNGVKFLFPEKAKGPVRWKQRQDACDSSEVHLFFPEAEKEIWQINLHWRVCQISFSEWEI